jgi:hypothetical protein
VNLGLLTALVDDAGVFPPEQLPMAAALARHRADQAAGHPMLTHRFLCPAGRLGELRTEMTRAGDGGPLRLGVIADTGLDGLAAVRAELASEPRLALETVEVPAASGDAVGAALVALEGFETAAFVEGPRDPGWIKQLAGRGGPGGLRGAKVRCGGARAELFPSSEELAGFVCACFEHGVPFKATAGLHAAVRHSDERTGFVHHGFLNLLVAAVRAASGAPVGDVAAALASTDGPALAGEARAVSARGVAAARSLFRAYGSCSTSEPREEAEALGLLDDPEAAGAPGA